ncbi:3-hydroxyisobutyrate dehydrogenase [Streptomyces sp. NBC_00841]|uniref:3-hydroxyisobutyrate dehydrogenase n=1 Tax=unclassified Streptomyces TaxID=2593676 RepID=UPI00225BA361|nr:MULTISPECIES: 3-hydroxyisobutyrate dehydrogenase [unclassified Streptomyces]MCX4530872.1 3-hydroxyisobutyrate dehydrogenase [Streptomyces sp. NBC_01669]WSA03381.1 3-hydroxyisobutyrate dehydrogenase [Streptomyces sp. NBC_00841]
MSTVGFIGLGNMGGPMAANLVTAGHDVRGYDLSPDALAAARQAGVTLAGSVADCVAGAQVVITMLPTGRHVRDVVVGPGGVVEHAAAGTLLIDSSTIDIQSSRAVHASLTACGLPAVDAPVSGGVAKAAAGTLTFMVGGEMDAVDLARPYLEAMGATIVHAGPAGTGQAAKICNNMLFGTTMTAVAESFVLAERLGLDAQRLFDIVTTSSGDSWALRNFCPWPGLVEGSAADNGYRANFAAALMSKDLRLALAAAEEAGVELPVSGRADELFRVLAATDGHLDASAVIHPIRGRD